MIHTPLTRLIEFVAAIPAMVAPNVLPRGQPMPRNPVTGSAPNRTYKAGVWAESPTLSLAGGLCTPAPSRGSVMKRMNRPERKDRRYSKATSRALRRLSPKDKRFQIADMERIRHMLGIRTGDAQFDAQINERLDR